MIATDVDTRATQSNGELVAVRNVGFATGQCNSLGPRVWEGATDKRRSLHCCWSHRNAGPHPARVLVGEYGIGWNRRLVHIVDLIGETPCDIGQGKDAIPIGLRDHKGAILDNRSIWIRQHQLPGFPTIDR